MILDDGRPMVHTHSEAPSAELNKEDGIYGVCGTYVGEQQCVEFFWGVGGSQK